MSGIISGLRFQKHTADRVNVYLDGEFAFGLTALDAAHLRVGQHLDDDEIARLQATDSLAQAYDRALVFLAPRPRSRAEVRRRLAEAGADPAVIEAALDRLAEQGYLNDAEFARFWVANRVQFRPRSPLALRKELRDKGLDAEVVAAAVADLDPAAGAYQAAHPRALRLAALLASDPSAFRRKLSDFLLRRGYDYGIVKEVVARLAEAMAGPDDSNYPEIESEEL